MSALPMNATCGFQGNPDIYGIGIRTGFYAQSLAAWFANFFCLEEAKALRKTNALFLFALAIALLDYTHDAPGRYAIEAFLLLQIGVLLGMTSISSATRYSHRHLKLSWTKVTLFNTFKLSAVSYGIYFWWSGIDVMMKTPCGTYGMFVVRADIYGPIRFVLMAFDIWRLICIFLGGLSWDILKHTRGMQTRTTRAAFLQYAMQNQGWSSEPTKWDPLSISPNPKPSLNKSRQQVNDAKEDATTTSANEERYSKETPFVIAWRRILETILFRASRHTSTTKPLSFEVVLEAEEYLEAILDVPMKVTSKAGFGWGGSRFRDYYISKSTFFKDYRNAAKICLREYCLLDLKYRNVREVVAMHSYMQKQPGYTWPRTVMRIVEEYEKKSPPDWRVLLIASDIKLSEQPLIPARTWALFAAWNFFYVAALILQVELTISWNHIAGLQDLATVGQSVPLIVGVGGLLLVLLKKWQQISKGYSEEKSEMMREPSDYEKAIRIYLDWKRNNRNNNIADERAQDWIDSG